jgi:hypothetical protein
MVRGTEKLVKKFAKGYERRSRTVGSYLAGSDLEIFLLKLIAEFSDIRICIRRDRGQGLTVSIQACDTRALLHRVYVRNTNARGLDRSPVKYELMLNNRDVNLEFP